MRAWKREKKPLSKHNSEWEELDWQNIFERVEERNMNDVETKNNGA